MNGLRACYDRNCNFIVIVLPTEALYDGLFDMTKTKILRAVLRHTTYVGNNCHGTTCKEVHEV